MSGLKGSMDLKDKLNTSTSQHLLQQQQLFGNRRMTPDRSGTTSMQKLSRQISPTQVKIDQDEYVPAISSPALKR